MRVPLLNLPLEYAELKSELDSVIASVVSTAAFVGGEQVHAFEREFAQYVEAGSAIGVGNGTDALELALQAVGVGPGDSVLTVPFTFAATVEAIVRVGGTPVFADIRDDDFSLDVNAAAAVLEKQRVKALIAVHLYGYPADMEAVLSLARDHNVRVVEDAAQAHGARCVVGGQQRRVGALGDAGCFSFYPTKNLGAMGDAGAVVTNNPEVAERVRLLASHGEAEKYRHVLANGRNSRLDGIQAAVLRVKLRHLDKWNAARRALAACYAERLADLPLRLPPERPGAESVYHQYVIRVTERDRLKAALTERGIGTAVHYPRPLHQQEGFRRFSGGKEFPVAERCAREVLSLPMFAQLGRDSVNTVCEVLREILA
jgi:dTDP-4-amino-4,6-dideoxygalactose transaminase